MALFSEKVFMNVVMKDRKVEHIMPYTKLFINYMNQDKLADVKYALYSNVGHSIQTLSSKVNALLHRANDIHPVDMHITPEQFIRMYQHMMDWSYAEQQTLNFMCALNHSVAWKFMSAFNVSHINLSDIVKLLDPSEIGYNLGLIVTNMSFIVADNSASTDMVIKYIRDHGDIKVIHTIYKACLLACMYTTATLTDNVKYIVDMQQWATVIEKRVKDSINDNVKDIICYIGHIVDALCSDDDYDAKYIAYITSKLEDICAHSVYVDVHTAKLLEYVSGVTVHFFIQ